MIKVFDFTKFSLLKDQRRFCGSFDADRNEALTPDPNFKMVYQNFGTGTTTVDIERPLEVAKGFNLVGGENYQFYVSSYVYKSSEKSGVRT